MSQSKICPKCQAVAPLDAAICQNCAHGFRTQFTQSSIACPDCGYMMTAFDAECVRCQRLGVPRPAPPALPQQKSCPNCRLECPMDTSVCPRCGYSAEAPPPPPPPIPAAPNAPQPVYLVSGDSISVVPGTHPVALVAIVGLFCLPVGMMMNRQFVKAVVVLACTVGICLVTYGIGGALLAIAAWIDSILIAQRLNRGETIGQWTSF